MKYIEFIKNTPLAYPLIKLKSHFVQPRSQFDESLILDRLVRRYHIPESFVEFGFSGWEFNCVNFCHSWRGLLIDGNRYNHKISSVLFGSNITSRHLWLTLESIDCVSEWVNGNELGILSVDVDGNDYWFLKELINLKPAIIIAEYNSTFGHRSITVPYDPAFRRFDKHPSGLYFGASLVAISTLCQRNSYSLVAVSNAGVNAFFLRNDLLRDNDQRLSPIVHFKEKLFLDRSSPDEQWEKIKGLDFCSV